MRVHVRGGGGGKRGGINAKLAIHTKSPGFQVKRGEYIILYRELTPLNLPCNGIIRGGCIAIISSMCEKKRPIREGAIRVYRI